jgi:hypothetical protein
MKESGLPEMEEKMGENSTAMNRESEQEAAAQREKKTIRRLLPVSVPNRFNIETITSEITSGRYSSSDKHRLETLMRAGIMTTYLDLDETRPLKINEIRIRLVDAGIYNEEDSFAGERNILVVLETLGFVTQKGNYVYLSEDFSPLFHRWKEIRVEIQREEVDRNAQKKEQLAKIKEKLAKEIGASQELKKQAREARREARRAAKAERIELYKAIGEEKDKARRALKEQREALHRAQREAKEKMRHASPKETPQDDSAKQDN